MTIASTTSLKICIRKYVPLALWDHQPLRPGRWGPSPRIPWHSSAGLLKGPYGVENQGNLGRSGWGLYPFHWWSWAEVFAWQMCRRGPSRWQPGAKLASPLRWIIRKPGNIERKSQITMSPSVLERHFHDQRTQTDKWWQTCSKLNTDWLDNNL